MKKTLINALLGSFLVAASVTSAFAPPTYDEVNQTAALYHAISGPGKKYLQPCPEELKARALEIPASVKNSEDPVDQKLMETVGALMENDAATSLDVFRAFVQYAADKTPQWSEGDKSVIQVLKISPKTHHLCIDETLTPQDVVEVIIDQMYPRGVEATFIQGDISGLFERPLEDDSDIFLLPVLTDKLFNPTTLVKHAIKNIFTLGIPTKPLRVHGLEISPMGQLLHDMAHAGLVINTKKRKLIKSMEAIYAKARQERASLTYGTEEAFVATDASSVLTDLEYDEQETFAALTETYLKAKQAAFEDALIQVVDAATSEENKLAQAGVFFAIHEQGIHAWPRVQKGIDVDQTLVQFFSKAKKEFEKYYHSTFMTSGADGTPLWDGDLPEELREGLKIPESAKTQVTVNGHTMTIAYRQGSSVIKHVLPTQKWITAESEDAQKMLAWAWGTKPDVLTPHPKTDAQVDNLATPATPEPEAAAEEGEAEQTINDPYLSFNTSTLMEIQFCLERAKTMAKKADLGKSLGQMLQAKRAYREGLEEAFQGEAYAELMAFVEKEVY